MRRIPGRSWFLAALVIASCGKSSRRATVDDDARAAPVDAMPDARWRDGATIGFKSDLLPLLERDCPADAPPFDEKTWIGKYVASTERPLGWYCKAEIRPGLWRLINAGFSQTEPSRAHELEVGYKWRTGTPKPAECGETLQREKYEYLAKVVSNDDGVHLTADDLRRIRHKTDLGIQVNTGPLYISGNSGGDHKWSGCTFLIWPWDHLEESDPAFGPRDAGAP